MKTLLTILGAGVIVYSLLTRYELGVVKVLAMRTHLILDALSGLVLIAAPFVLDVDDDEIMWTLIVLGILEIGASLTTETEPRAHEPTMTERA